MEENSMYRLPYHLDRKMRKAAKEEERKVTGNHLLLFPVSRLRIPKIPDFC